MSEFIIKALTKIEDDFDEDKAIALLKTSENSGAQE